jgi:NDP-sugar pyrophosphorylase family protein
MLLTGGLGTRLRPLTAVRAKPAIPVGGVPLVRRIIKWLTTAGVTDFVLNLHHLPETITAVVGDGSDLSARVRYSWEQPRILGSAGGPRLALPLIEADTFLVVNGDTLTDVDLNALAAAHADARALVTLALVPNVEPDRYGGLRLAADGRVEAFVPRGKAAEGSHHFIGIQIASADAFRSLAPGEPVKSIGGVYDRLMAERPGSVRGFVSSASFHDIGTAADYLRTSEAFATSEQHDGAGRRANIAATARITRSILWDDVDIGEHSAVERCIVTDRVRVPPRAEYRDAILIASPDGAVIASPLNQHA